MGGVAIIGSGIAGLATAWLLRRQGQHVALFESSDYLGGHTHTIDVTLDGVAAPVDTGFLVYNERTYPKLVELFAELGVASSPSNMSFSVRDDAAGVEWSGTSLRALFAQSANVLRPAFWRMLAEILRFNREASALHREDSVYAVTLGEFLDAQGYSTSFRDWYLVPMAASIWSSPRREILDFPLPTFVRFCHYHGLLQMVGRPQWRTVAGGARTYVHAIAAAIDDVRLRTAVHRVRRRGACVEIDSAAADSERFDQVVLACHSDEALRLLADPSRDEANLLSSIDYQANRAVLHTDTALMPKRRRAWSAWNYLNTGETRDDAPVAVSYWLNQLQPLPFSTPLFITLNPPTRPRASALIAEFDYSHPLVKGAAVTAQQRFARIQGARRTWYAGAWLGYGFHEDGVASAHVVAAGVAHLARTSAAERAAA